MRLYSLAVVAVVSVTAATPAMAQFANPAEGHATPIIDRSIESNSVCGTMENAVSSVCRPGMIYNKGGDAERKQTVSDQQAKQRAEVQAVLEQRKATAHKLAERVKAGAEVPPALVEQIRAGLARDIELWRAAYAVSEAEGQAVEKRWLREPASLTPAEWVLWRAAWFDDRDKWIAANTGG